MTGFPGSPPLVKGGLVLVDPASGRVLNIITVQYNPDSLSRSLQIKATTTDSPDRSEVLRLKGPPVETIKLDAEIDATAETIAEEDAARDRAGRLVDAALRIARTG